MGISYMNSTEGLRQDHLEDFFEGWVVAPSNETRLEMLRNSYAVWLAFDGDLCAGFINALSDGVFYSYIPLVEVVPAYRGQGIGSELVRRMLKTLGRMYAIDIVCDEAIATFYEKLDFAKSTAMIKRKGYNH